MVPPETNRGRTVAGDWVCRGVRKPAQAGYRDEAPIALAALLDRSGQQVFTVRKVYAEMLAAGTPYAELTC